MLNCQVRTSIADQTEMVKIRCGAKGVTVELHGSDVYPLLFCPLCGGRAIIAGETTARQTLLRALRSEKATI